MSLKIYETSGGDKYIKIKGVLFSIDISTQKSTNKWRLAASRIQNKMPKDIVLWKILSDTSGLVFEEKDLK